MENHLSRGYVVRDIPEWEESWISRRIAEKMNDWEYRGHRYVTYAECPGSGDHILFLTDEEGRGSEMLHWQTGQDGRAIIENFYIVQARRRETWRNVQNPAVQEDSIWRWDILRDEFEWVEGLQYEINQDLDMRYERQIMLQRRIQVTWRGLVVSDSGEQERL